MDGNSGHLRIEPSDLLNVAEKLDSLSDDMRKNLNDMTECINEIKQIWKDENGVDFVDKYTNKVEPELSKYYRVVEKHSGFISGAAKSYREVFSVISQSINSPKYVNNTQYTK